MDRLTLADRSLAAGLALLFAATLATPAAAGRIRLSPFQDLVNVKKVLGLVLDDYVEEKADRTELLYGAVQGMLEKLDDPYTRFMTPETFDNMQTETSGKFGGLGILIGEKRKRLTVIAPIPETPAYKVGIRAGDVIAKVDGQSTKGMTVNDAVKLLRGPKGAPVILSVARKGERKLLDYKIVRDIIKVSSVRSKMLDASTGYAHLTGFIQTTGEDLRKAVTEMARKYDMKGFVLDLRNNPGGLLTAALDVSRIFLDEETIVSIKGRRGRDIVYKGEGQSLPELPIVVLINEGSASASEIVAGAVKDNRRGLLLGKRSFGKGSVQTVMPLHGGAALALTTAYYYTPSGVCIHKKGIHPDVEVPMPRLSDEEILEFRGHRESQLSEEGGEFLEVSRFDHQLQRAVEILRAARVFGELYGEEAGEDVVASTPGVDPGEGSQVIPVPAAEVGGADVQAR